MQVTSLYKVPVMGKNDHGILYSTLIKRLKASVVLMCWYNCISHCQKILCMRE